MAASKITFADKVGIIPKDIRINQVWDDDINEIKTKFNANATLIDTNTSNITSNSSDILDLQNAGKKAYKIVNVTSSYNANENDYILADTTTGSITITLPDATLFSGYEINVTKKDAIINTITINTVLSQTINGELTKTITNQYTNITLVSSGLNWFIK